MTDNTDRDTQQKLDRMNSGLYWWGVPTLFRCPHDPNPEHCDIALVGVPHSTGNGTTERDQHLGQERCATCLRLAVGYTWNLPWTRGNNAESMIWVMWRCPKPTTMKRGIQRITDFYKSIDQAGVRPVSVGGDHSVTGGILQAIAGKDARLTQGKKTTLLHFDAHTDAFHHIEHFLGAYKSAAHWASYLVRDGHVNPHNSVQVGIRGNPRTLDWLEPSYDLGYEVIDIKRFRQIGVDKAIEIINRRIGDEPVYITFDLDALDTTVAPGVANLEAGIEGLYIDETMKMLRSVRGKNIIGGDVVCLMPTKDAPNKQTSLVAMSIMFEIISLIADNMAR